MAPVDRLEGHKAAYKERACSKRDWLTLLDSA
jgi:hypothetical protein